MAKKYVTVETKFGDVHVYPKNTLALTTCDKLVAGNETLGIITGRVGGQCHADFRRPQGGSMGHNVYLFPADNSDASKANSAVVAAILTGYESRRWSRSALLGVTERAAKASGYRFESDAGLFRAVKGKAKPIAAPETPKVTRKAITRARKPSMPALPTPTESDTPAYDVA